MGGLGGSRVMGGMNGVGNMQDMGSHRAPVPTPTHSSSSFFSSDEVYRAYNFPDHIPDTIPSVIFPHDVPPPPGGHPHVLASVAVGVYIVMVCRWTDHILARNPLLEVEADLF